jgi:threonine aldolase
MRHIFLHAPGCVAALMGVPFFPLRNERDGTIDLNAITAAIKADNVHYPRTKLLALENTQNRLVNCFILCLKCPYAYQRLLL